MLKSQNHSFIYWLAKQGSYISLILSLPAPQLPGSSLACSVSINTKHLWGWRCLVLLLGQMPLDSRLHDSQHLSRGAAEGPRTPGVLCSPHLAHSVSPWSQPPATRPHQGHLQPLYQADLKTHSQVSSKKPFQSSSWNHCRIRSPRDWSVDLCLPSPNTPKWP